MPEYLLLQSGDADADRVAHSGCGVPQWIEALRSRPRRRGGDGRNHLVHVPPRGKAHQVVPASLGHCLQEGWDARAPTHDFRRTAVRNLERAGVPRSTAMKMVGHRTESIYRRYAIVDEAMLKEGAVKLQILHDTQQGPAANVVSLVDVTRSRRLGSSTGRVTGRTRRKIGRGLRGKSSKSEEKIMVGRDGIEPPTPGFSVLCSTN